MSDTAIPAESDASRQGATVSYEEKFFTYSRLFTFARGQLFVFIKSSFRRFRTVEVPLSLFDRVEIKERKSPLFRSSMIWAFASATLIIPACVNVYQYLSQASFNSIFVFGLFSIANAAIAYQERGTFRVANFYSKSGKPLTIWARGPDAERFDDFVVLVTNRVERMKSARQGNMT